MSKIPPRNDAKQMFRQEIPPSKYFIMADSQDTFLLNPSSTGLISYKIQTTFIFTKFSCSKCRCLHPSVWPPLKSSGFRITLTKNDHCTKDNEIYHVLVSTDHMGQLCSTLRGCGTCSGEDGMAEMQIDIFSHMYFREFYTQCRRGTCSGWVAS